MDNQSGSTRPQLKKIKRPINRTIPQTEARPVMQNTSPFVSSSQPFRNKTEDIDSYLDEPSLPSKDVREQAFAAAPAQISEEPRYIEEDAYEEEVYGRRAASAGVPEWLTLKVFVLIACICLFIGVVAGKVIFAEAKVVRNGLQGVVVNAEVPRGRARCGVAERTQGCVLYIMNPQRQDMRAKDFYDLASQMTGRQRFMIETGNMRYANSKIKPGDIVQLNIPPL